MVTENLFVSEELDIKSKIIIIENFWFGGRLWRNFSSCFSCREQLQKYVCVSAEKGSAASNRIYKMFFFL